MTKKLLLALILLNGLGCSLFAEYRILAFGDSNTWGWIPNGGGTRYSDTDRWAGILESELGEDYSVICDGLVARRTNLDGMTAGLIDGSFLNGAKTLPASIARNGPIDLVILFLGTNDLQLGAERTASEVASAVAELAQLASEAKNLLYANYPSPEVWVVTPPAFGDLSNSALKDLFAPGQLESQKLSSSFKELEKTHSIKLIETNVLQVDGVGPDGIHLNKHGHELLGKAISRAISSKHREL